MSLRDWLAALDRGAGETLDPVQAADLAWLVSLWPDTAPERPTPRTVELRGSFKGRARARGTLTIKGAEEDQPAASLSEPVPSAPSELHVQVPSRQGGLDAPPLRRALAPLRLRGHDPQRTVLDEHRTVEIIAETEVWHPVFASETRKRLSATLVVDVGRSMDPWRQQAHALVTLLQTLGVFCTVRLWAFDSDLPLERLWIGWPRGTPAAVPGAVLARTTDELILVLSDCIGEAWQGGSALEVLSRWSSVHPTAIVQVLDELVWDTTVLGRGRTIRGEIDRRFLPLLVQPGDQRLPMPAHVTWSDARARQRLRLPVFPLSEVGLRAWSRFLRGQGPIYGRTFRAEQAQDEDGFSSASGAERVKAFMQTASPQGRRLAAVLPAAWLISLPILSHLQEILGLGLHPAPVAEVLSGGLLEVIGIRCVEDPDQTSYELAPGVLRALMEYADDTAVLEAARSLTWKLDRGDWHAWLTRPRDHAGAGVDVDLPPNLVLLLERLGGMWAGILRASEIEVPRTQEQHAMSVFNYTDYRQFIADAIQQRGLSLRVFARKLNYSPSWLSGLLSGRGSLDPVLVDVVARALSLDEDETDFLAALVDLENPSPRVRRNARLRIAAQQAQINTLQSPHSVVFSDWYPSAILELSRCENFQADPAWIAEILKPPISEEQAYTALRSLQEIGLVGDQGRTPPDVGLPPKHLTDVFHRRMLELAANALLTHRANERYMSTITLAISEEQYPLLVRRLRELEMELSFLSSESGAPNRVYTLGFTFFPVSETTDRTGDR
jgi:uncharacterized protein (TIGR02147 family)